MLMTDEKALNISGPPQLKVDINTAVPMYVT